MKVILIHPIRMNGKHPAGARLDISGSEAERLIRIGAAVLERESDEPEGDIAPLGAPPAHVEQLTKAELKAELTASGVPFTVRDNLTVLREKVQAMRAEK